MMELLGSELYSFEDHLNQSCKSYMEERLEKKYQPAGNDQQNENFVRGTAQEYESRECGYYCGNERIAKKGGRVGIGEGRNKKAKDKIQQDKIDLEREKSDLEKEKIDLEKEKAQIQKENVEMKAKMA